MTPNYVPYIFENLRFFKLYELVDSRRVLYLAKYIISIIYIDNNTFLILMRLANIIKKKSLKHNGCYLSHSGIFETQLSPNRIGKQNGTLTGKIIFAVFSQIRKDLFFIQNQRLVLLCNHLEILNLVESGA